EKPVNKALIERLKQLHAKQVPIESMLGKLFIEQGKITCFPISFHINGGFKYPSIMQEIYVVPVKNASTQS
nr:hypothetical protein [Candidatus Sigynarchaeota archaeon]